MVWDLDGTLWDDVVIEAEADRLPALRPWVMEAIDALADVGVLSSVASRTAPWVRELLRGAPELDGRFLVPQIGWQDKSESLRRIADELGIGLGSLALVDDSPYERAEVCSMLPGVLVLAPKDIPDLIGTLRSAPVTPDARRRVGRYREELRRREAGERFRGSKEDFLRSCAMRLTLGEADDTEVGRFAELATRTHRLNSAGLAIDAAEVRSKLARGCHALFAAHLTDRFGDYGLIGAALVERRELVWSVDLLALSCRIAGRGVSTPFLSWIAERAVLAGATELRTVFHPTSANLELRILLRQMGLGSADGVDRSADREGTRTLSRPLSGELPARPPWIEVIERKEATA